MEGGSRNVDRIGTGLRRQRHSGEQRERESGDFVVDGKYGHFGQIFGSTRRGRRISRRGLVEDGLRNIEIEFSTSFLPPVVGDPLVGGRNKVAAGPGGQVADHARFKVNPWAHARSLALKNRRAAYRV